MKHDYYDREDGLLHCKVCNGGEGSLPTDCPGRRMTHAEEEQVYGGTLDYRAGQWVDATNFVPTAGVTVDRHQTFSQQTPMHRKDEQT